jgi:uncharacterized membrane protein YdjX (TVP38/TMEM64 family)
MRDLFRRLLVPALLVGLLLSIGIYLSRYATTDWMIRNEIWMRDSIRHRPVGAWLIGFVAYFALSLIPGTTGKSIVLGWLFGFAAGVVLVNCALTLAAIITFLVARHYIQDAIQSRFAVMMSRLNRRLERDGAIYQLTIRHAHAPFSLVNYGTGAGTHVPLRTFWWTTQLGLLPGICVMVFAGSRLPTLQELAQNGPLQLIDPLMWVALAATVFVPFVIRRLTQALRARCETARKLRIPEAEEMNGETRC